MPFGKRLAGRKRRRQLPPQQKRLTQSAVGGEGMSSRIARTILSLSVLIVGTFAASAQSFRVQCPTSTITHPNAANNNAEPAYNGPTAFSTGLNGYQVPTSSTVNGAIKCQQVSGGDG